MSHDNIAIVRRWFEEVWNQRRSETIEELMTNESICYADDGPMKGPEEFKERQLIPFLAAFPDLRVNLDAMIGQEDQVVVRWTAVGQHTGHGLGLSATQSRVEFRGISWIRVCGGKMMEGWQSSNIPEVIRGLRGLAPI